jgi:hypothetical protein
MLQKRTVGRKLDSSFFVLSGRYPVPKYRVFTVYRLRSRIHWMMDDMIRTICYTVDVLIRAKQVVAPCEISFLRKIAFPPGRLSNGNGRQMSRMLFKALRGHPFSTIPSMLAQRTPTFPKTPVDVFPLILSTTYTPTHENPNM